MGFIPTQSAEGIIGYPFALILNLWLRMERLFNKAHGKLIDMTERIQIGVCSFEFFLMHRSL